MADEVRKKEVCVRGGGGGSEESPVMDTSRWGWVVVAASFWINGTIFGVINTQGVLFVQLKEKYIDKENVSAYTSLVGSLCIGMTFLLSAVTGILTDQIGVRKMAFAGSVLATLGMFLSSFVEQLEWYYVTYGVLLGTGSSLAYTPSLVILGHYFRRHIGVVNGIVTFGSSLFTVCLPFLLKYLYMEIGLKYTLQLLSLQFSTLILCSFVFRPRQMETLQQQQQQQQQQEQQMMCPAHRSWRSKYRQFCCKLVNVSIWRNKRYTIWALTVPAALFGYFVPYVHLVQYVKEILPNEDGEILVICIGATSGFGRIMFGVLADHEKIRPHRILLQQISFFSIGVLTILLPIATNFESLIILCLGLGLFDGCFISLLGPIALDLTGQKGATQAIGFLLGLCSIPLTLGPPIAGWIRDHLGSYDVAFVCAGIPPIVGSIIMFLIKRVSADPSVKLPTTAALNPSEYDEATCLTSGNIPPVIIVPRSDGDVESDKHLWTKREPLEVLLPLNDEKTQNVIQCESTL